MLHFSFTRQPAGSMDEPLVSVQPELGCQVGNGWLELRVYGENDFGLGALFDGKQVPFEGQSTYNELRQIYRTKVGSAFSSVLLLGAPALTLEQTPEGWCVLRQGGAEYPHFDGLVSRLEANSFKGAAISGRDGCPGVAIQIVEGEEFEAFDRLIPIITNT